MFPLNGDGGKILKTHSVLDKSLAGASWCPWLDLLVLWGARWGAGLVVSPGIWVILEGPREKQVSSELFGTFWQLGACGCFCSPLSSQMLQRKWNNAEWKDILETLWLVGLLQKGRGEQIIQQK